MGIPLPTPDDLAEYREGVTDAEALQRAGDLLVMATGVSSVADDYEQRLVKMAVIDMALAITERHDTEFSPFSSERIGSYSYSKAVAAVSKGSDTGISSFDLVVAYFLAQAMGGSVSSIDSEFVFKPGFDKQFEFIPSAPPVFITTNESDVVVDEYGNVFLEVD